MTTVYLSPDNPAVGTHVLVIGVGAYTHLHDGLEPADNTYGLGQLSSPPHSALAMLDWFLEPLRNPAAKYGFRNVDAPLASVEALIAAPAAVEFDAPHGAQPAQRVALDGARLVQVRAAFEKWRRRLMDAPGSTGIFYFCGHGVSTHAHYLLCQDLLEDEGVAWERAFPLEATLQHLTKDTQDCHLHFWIDACREGQGDMLLSNSSPHPLRMNDITKPTVERSHSILRSTGDGQLAFAKKGKPSRFTSALLKSLSGYAGSRRAGGRWQVDSAELAAAVRELLRVESSTAERKQYSTSSHSGDEVPIVHLTGPVQVDVCLRLEPDAMREHGQIHVESMDRQIKDVHSCADGDYTKAVARGMYHLGARSAGGQFEDSNIEYEEVKPPLYMHTFKVFP